MTQSPSSSSGRPAALDAISRPVSAELAETTELLKARLFHSDATMGGYLDYSFKMGGKRLRPTLLLLCAKAWGRVDRRCRLCAAALEMIHTGSLVHDDILDGAQFRRQLETVNAKWDSHRAVLIGDLLITRAFDLICECDDSVVFRKVAQFCQATVEGELFQTDSIGNFGLGVDDYRKIVGGKTASLIEGASFLGGYLAGAEGADLADFGRFGSLLGIAFQIVDDVLDLVGDEQQVGKTLGSDLANKKETLPLILYLQNASDSDAREMLERVNSCANPEERGEVASILRESGAIDGAAAEARKLIDEAIAITERLRSRARTLGLSGDAEAFDSLAELASFVVQRKL